MGSTLQGFLQRFNDSSGHTVNVIDPLNTFDITVEFFPNIATKAQKLSTSDKIKGLAKQAVHNLTGGLVSMAKKDTSILKLLKQYRDRDIGKASLMGYIIDGYSLTDGNDKYVMDITYYVQLMSLPLITTADVESIRTQVGEFNTNGIYVKPSSNNFTMDIINTKAPILESVFYPWMRETTLPFWAYNDYPYTTADITIDFKKHADVAYLFIGCRPTNIGTYTPSNNSVIITRLVLITFDYMIVSSSFKTLDSVNSAMKGLGNNLKNSALKMIGM